MRWLNGILIAFSVLSIGLGVYGMVTKGSPISLIAGGTAGILMLGTVFLAQKQPRIGRILSLVVALGMLGNFLPKFLKTNDWLPAGTMAVASIFVILALIGGHLAAMQAKKSATPSAE